jgi:hypothetical protein
MGSSLFPLPLDIQQGYFQLLGNPAGASLSGILLCKPGEKLQVVETRYAEGSWAAAPRRDADKRGVMAWQAIRALESWRWFSRATDMPQISLRENGHLAVPDGSGPWLSDWRLSFTAPKHGRSAAFLRMISEIDDVPATISPSH